MKALQDVFSNFGYTITAGQANAACVTSTFRPDWIEKYFSEGFDKIDPIFQFARQHQRRCGHRILTHSDMATPLFEEARAVAADSNVMITDYFGGSTMVLGGVNPDITEAEIPDLVNTCKVTHRKAIAKRFYLLTEKQIELLEMSEMGYRDNEISYELAISPSAISQRKKAICNALGLTNYQVAAQLYTAQKWSGIIAS